MSYRVLNVFGHKTTKVIHGIWHTVTVGLIITALIFIIQFHSDQNWGHLSTMHSWCAVLLLAVYFQNWLLGLIFFAFGDTIPLEWKTKYLPSHRFLGIVGFFLAAVVMETGIEQKSWLDGSFGCIYTIINTEKWNNPAAHYLDIAEGCRVGFGIGIMIAINAVVAVYALWDFNAGAVSASNAVTDKKDSKPEDAVPSIVRTSYGTLA